MSQDPSHAGNPQRQEIPSIPQEEQFSPSQIPASAPPPPSSSMPGASPSTNQFTASPKVMNQPEQGRGMAIAGFILGLLSIIAWLIPLFGLPISLVGIVLAALGRRRVPRYTLGGYDIATLGLNLAVIALLLTLISAVCGFLSALQHMGPLHF